MAIVGAHLHPHIMVTGSCRIIIYNKSIVYQILCTVFVIFLSSLLFVIGCASLPTAVKTI